MFSVNLIAAMGAIANIARQRPDYMSRVVQTFEALQGGNDLCIGVSPTEGIALFVHSSQFTSDFSGFTS